MPGYLLRSTYFFIFAKELDVRQGISPTDINNELN